MSKVTINKKQKLYCIPQGKGYYSTLGFTYAKNKTLKIAEYLNKPELIEQANKVGTMDGYNAYLKACEFCHDYYVKTKKQVPIDLCEQLIGLEGRRVEVVDLDGATRRFKVGKSTGFIPCHLEVHNSRSLGGVAASESYKSVRIIK